MDQDEGNQSLTSTGIPNIEQEMSNIEGQVRVFVSLLLCSSVPYEVKIKNKANLPDGKIGAMSAIAMTYGNFSR